MGPINMGDRFVTVLKLSNQQQIADQCSVADHFLSRLKGWMGVSSLARGSGLLLSPCNDIHMWFMRVSIDAVFLQYEKTTPQGAHWKVTSVFKELKPWKVLPVRDASAQATLELPAGMVASCAIEKGDTLCISSQ